MKVFLPICNGIFSINIPSPYIYNIYIYNSRKFHARQKKTDCEGIKRNKPNILNMKTGKKESLISLIHWTEQIYEITLKYRQKNSLRGGAKTLVLACG